jgi:hypothetical protein
MPPPTLSGMSRRILLVLALLFVATRIPMAWLAATPSVYAQDGIDATSDVGLYTGWADALVDQGQGAYSEVRIEYPPGSLPFILGPKIVPGDEYLRPFIGMCVLIDIAAMFGLYLMAKRWGSWWGMALWVIALPALGPIAYLRLDLVPAVAMIWAFERLSSDDWLGGGGWLGVGAIAKLYPLLFLPAGTILAKNRARFLVAAIAVFCAPLIPLIPSIDGVASSVLGYHTERGIQIESLWGGILFLAMKSGDDVTLGYSFGALHFAGDLADTLKTVATLASVAALAFGTWIATRVGDRDRAKAFVEVSFVILAFSLFTGSVFSPQFLIWLLAIAGAVGCMADSRLRPLIVVLLPTAILTQAIFPFNYLAMLASEDYALALLWVRNALVGVIGIAAAITLLRTYRKVSVPSTPEPVSG